jgi:hypothetical protein
LSVIRTPLLAMLTPKEIAVVPAGTAGVTAVAVDHAVTAGRRLTSVQNCQPVAVLRNSVMALFAAVLL